MIAGIEHDLVATRNESYVIQVSHWFDDSSGETRYFANGVGGLRSSILDKQKGMRYYSEKTAELQAEILRNVGKNARVIKI